MIKTPKPYRLDKYLCACGQGSRSQVTRLIKHGRVKVNGYVTTSGATRIVSTDTVHLDDVLLSEAAPVLLWHKPTGVQCTIGDPMGRISLVDLIPSDILNRYHPVGRLDADTSGLLLFSRFGALTQRLLHPKHGLPRSYQAICEAPFTADQIATLESGVSTSLGTFSATVTHNEATLIELSVTEGKYRMVRRMLANVGQPVSSLKRIKYGPFELNDMILESLREPTAEEFDEAVTIGLPGFAPQ